jgi:hypothetical protein
VGSEPATRREKRWATLRFVLGIAQMSGAVLSAVLLLREGMSAASLGAVVATSACTTLSVLLFGGRNRRSGS